MFCVPGTLWLLIQSRWKDTPVEEPGPVSPNTIGEEEVIESRIG